MQNIRQKMEGMGSVENTSQGVDGEDFDSSPEIKNMGDEFLMDPDDGDFDDDDDLIDDGATDEDYD